MAQPMDRPRPAPRPARGRREHIDDAYSSSEGEEDTGCRRLGNSALRPLEGDMHVRPYVGRRALGLARNEHHISPIENLDNTISRLYSYLSGSEGEVEADQSLSPTVCKDQWELMGRPRSRCDSCSGSSRSSSASRGEPGRLHDRTMDTLDSAGTGDNVYSRINDTATLPRPPIPPPPLEDAPGPAVPPRRNFAKLTPAQTQTGERRGRSGNYAEVDSDFEPQFLVQTASGNVFIPPAHSSPPGSPVLSFAMNVPKTSSLPHHVAPATPDSRCQSQASRAATLPDHPTSNSDSTTQTTVPTSSSTDRQNVGFNPNAALLPPLPTYPSIQNDFRDYRQFNSTSFRVKKHFNGRCSWRCTALIFMFLTLAMSAVVAYFVAMKVYNLNWKLEKHPLAAGDPDMGNDTSARHPGLTKGAALPTTPSVIIVQYPLGKVLEQTVPPHSYWRTQFYMPEGKKIKFNFTVPIYAVFGVYGRRNVQPSHAQHDFFHVIDGHKISLRNSRQKRNPQLPSQGSAFAHYMESGLWYVFIYNDNDIPQKVAFVGTEQEIEVSQCPNRCHGRGECRNEQCRCFPGYTGWDCSQSECPVLCRGNGFYVEGACKCHEGWKGKECSVASDDCEDPTCSNNGKCVGGQCVCSPGFKGPNCSEVDCLTSNCSGNGACVEGRCICFHGYSGSDCSLPALVNVTMCIQHCSGRGLFDLKLNKCVCQEGWSGDQCETEVCTLDCIHGRCKNQRCECDSGWSGASCDQVECDRRCYDHGYCNNGTCVCKPGWNGKHCSLEGCRNDCSNKGTCQLIRHDWKCGCNSGWKGRDCSLAMETECNDKEDNDDDGLIDCLDSDCCISTSCKDDNFCKTAPDPMEILLRKQPPSTTASFYDRMRFLVEEESVQSYATLSSFNQSQVSVIRGKVLSADGSPLVGVRVLASTQPLYGFTLTRELGLFDILVNGGGSVTLLFKRQPFADKQTTVMAPWNRIVTMDPVTLSFEEDDEDQLESCEQMPHDHYVMKPVVLSTWQHTQLGACPSVSTIIPESQVLQESLQIPGTDIYMVYHSSETPGYMSTIMIQLTPVVVPDTLLSVHLRVTVEGLVFEKEFEADPTLTYKFAWDRRNAYNQKVYGIVTAYVGVGYKYQGCDRIFWEMQSATLSGYDITSSEIGGWNIHIHHTYNFQEGILHKGDGTNIYLKERPRKVITVLGTGKQRRSDCKGCDGTTFKKGLLAPVALASGRDGSLYVGDFNHIRKLSPSREQVTSILELNVPDIPYKYFMTVSPLDGKLYISDYQSKQIIRVKTMGAVRELSENSEIIAGTGELCVPGDKMRCGDGAAALTSKLLYPKGIAINKDGIIYFADGANIRKIDKNNVIQTVIGSQGQPGHWSPLPCDKMVAARDVTLHWPTAIAINPLDDTLHILDNNMVLKVTEDDRILIFAGHPLHCPPQGPTVSPLLSEEQSGPKLATQVTLEAPQHIAFAPNGDLYIVESDGKLINRVRVVKTDGRIVDYAGAVPKCSCAEADCTCFDAKEILATKMLLDSPTAITVTPDNVLHISDMGNLRIHSIVATLPEADGYGQYSVLYPQTQELYVFNKHGQHIATKNIITDKYLYNFTYNVNSFYGKLVKIRDSGGNVLTIRRDYNTQADEITLPGGQRCRFVMDNMFQLHKFIAADNATTRFTYLGNIGLLETKETTEGHTFLYEYDEIGRLSQIVQPTGERTSVTTDVAPTGALARLTTESSDLVAMATNGNMLSILHGAATTKVSYLRDGALVVEYPFNMAVTMETSPHPLLSTEHQLQVKRKIILPDNLIHRLEWRYYVRREKKAGRTGKVVDKVGRRMRVGKTQSRHVARTRLGATPLHEPHPGFQGAYDGKKLMINGENLLTLEYGREDHTERVFNKMGEEILTIHYTRDGQPINIIPAGPVQSLNISYNPRGHMTSWWRGQLSITNTFDEKSDRLLERTMGSKPVATYRYIYKTGTKPTDVIQPSGKQYLLHYDHHGNLKSVIMPNQAHHRFHSLASLGRYRHVYTPPNSHAPYVEEYDSSGKLRLVVYPTELRRINYYYDELGQSQATYYDWTDIHYKYHEGAGILHSMNLTDRVANNFSCSLLYQTPDALVKHHTVLFGHSEFLKADFMYYYDANFRVVSFETLIGDHVFRPMNYSYSAGSGKLEKMKGFTFEYPALHKEVTRDSSMTITKDYDNYDRLTDVGYKFNNHMVYTMEIEYDEMNRIHKWRRKIGTSDLKAYEYNYDTDGNLIDARINSQRVWHYDVDANNNILKVTHHKDVTQNTYNTANQIETRGSDTYSFDKDGFMVKRNNEAFEYSARRELVRAFETGKYDIRYFYDAEERLVARKDILKNDITQYFYGDIKNPNRITHMYNRSSNLITVLYYDSRGELFAMERGASYYYISLDPLGSPAVIVNNKGTVVKQITYDPLGKIVSDSNSDFPFYFGYQCQVYDGKTGLLFYPGRVYDPAVGRWTSARYGQFLERVSRILEQPEIVNHYLKKFPWKMYWLPENLMTDIPSWLNTMGYDFNSLVPRVSFAGEIRSRKQPPVSQRLISVKSAFECAFERDMRNFVDISSVPVSKVTSLRQNQKVIGSFSPYKYIFGEGLLLSSENGRVTVDVLPSANERMAVLATTLLNNTEVVPMSHLVHGRDVHYFVKRTLSQAAEDVRDLSLREQVMVDGINVTVHRHHVTPEHMKYVDIRLHGNHTVLNVRYGSTVEHETERILKHSQKRAVQTAWQLERQLVSDKLQSVHQWSKEQREELLSKGSVLGVEGRYVRNVHTYPQLADDPKNIRFVQHGR